MNNNRAIKALQETFHAMKSDGKETEIKSFVQDLRAIGVREDVLQQFWCKNFELWLHMS